MKHQNSMMGFSKSFLLVVILVCNSQIPTCLSQKKSPPAPKKAPASTLNETCDGIYLSYEYVTGRKIPPANATATANDPTPLPGKPYRFESTLTVLNNGRDELKDWQVFIDFHHGEILVSVSGAVLPYNSDLPANVSNGTIFSGFPLTDLKSGIQTAGDLTQMMAKVDLVGVEFGVPPKDKPMPNNLTLLNHGFDCNAQHGAKDENTTELCCQVDPNYKQNNTAKLSPRETGDLTIMYDVLKAYPDNYLAQVTLSNNDPIARLYYWQLGWQWMREEFIYQMRGAYPSVIDPSSCVYGPQPKFYQKMDLSSVLTCDPNPSIVDLPPTLKNDTNLGLLPECCRNGTILPATMDPAKSKSVFQMTVFKMPPDLNVTTLYPPQHWTINGTSTDQVYRCGDPIRVSPSLLLNPQGLPAEIEAIASWQVVCNRTQVSYPKCCVSFSSYFNESAIPCRTCACGCEAKKLSTSTCNATADPMLLPAYALLRPFENRTEIATEYARIHNLPRPHPLPCPDNCEVSVNWHLNSDFKDGWSSKITIINWGDISYDDWSLAVTLDKAGPGFDKMDKFNGSTLQNDSTIFMHGFYHLNDYLNALQNGSDPDKDLPKPGLLQSLMSFNKKKTPGINVAGPDGFPVRVFFNGGQCSLPSMLPVESKGQVLAVASWISTLLLAAFALMLLMYQ